MLSFRLLSAFAGVALMTSSSSGFMVQTSGQRPRTALHMAPKTDDTIVKDLVNAFGIVALASALVFNAPAEVSAATTEHTNSMVVYSSSIQVSDAIRTMDMSLPTYDKISDAQTGAEELKSLSKEAVKEAEGGSLGISLPKSKNSPSTKQVTRQKAEVEKEDKPNPKIKIVEMDLPSYSENTATKERGAFSL